MAYRRAFPGIQRAVRAAVASGGGGGDPYPWYPALDLNQIPFHVGAGTHGAQQVIEAPSAPVNSNGSTSVSTVSAFEAAAGTTGRIINVTASMGDVFLDDSTLHDLDIVLGSGVHIGTLSIGNGVESGSPSSVQRIRIRAADGVSATQCSVNALRSNGSVVQDLIFDGIGMRGRGAAPFYMTLPNRVAMVNCVARADQELALIGPTNFVIAGCNFASGYEPDPGGSATRWTLRAGAGEGGTGPFIVYNSRIESLSGVGDRSYHRLRFHPRVGGGQMYLWASNNVYVDSREARGVWVELVGINNLTDRVTSAWAINSTAYLRYLNSGAYYSESYSLQAVQNVARATGVTFYGDLTLTDQQGVNATSLAADADHTTGCTFNAWQDPPAWGGPGSPLLLPT